MAEQTRCEWCSRRIVDDQAIGRRKRYCSQSCRQRSYEKRRQMNGSAIAVAADAVVISRGELESLQDRLWVLRSAVEVLQGAVEDQSPAAELRNVAREVVAASGDLDRLWVTP